MLCEQHRHETISIPANCIFPLKPPQKILQLAKKIHKIFFRPLDPQIKDKINNTYLLLCSFIDS